MPAVAGGERGFHFPEFLFDFGHDIFGVFPVETDARGFALNLIGFQQRRQAARNFGVNRGGFFLGFLNVLPLPEHFPAGVGFSFAKHVRMPAEQFLGNRFGNGVKIELSGFAGDLGMENDLQKQITEFIAKLRHVTGVESVECFVGFFDEIVANGPVRLFAIPRAAGRTAQPSHDLQQPGDVFGLRRHAELATRRRRISYCDCRRKNRELSLLRPTRPSGARARLVRAGAIPRAVPIHAPRR